MKNQTGKRILSVTIKHIVDDSPDTSWRGEYSARATSEFSIDRAHSEDCPSVSQSAKDAIDKLERIVSHIDVERRAEGYKCQRGGSSPEWEALDDAVQSLLNLQDELAECDCGERGDMGRNEDRYFNPSFNYVDKNGKALPENTPEEVRKYTRQDYDRMESLNAGNWYFLGISAEAEIGIPDTYRRVHPLDPGSMTLQRITSGGLWGIESDSNKSDFAEVEQEQLSELRAQLKALGFSSRAISMAFKNMQRKDN
jgi:hypothetical protein